MLAFARDFSQNTERKKAKLKMSVLAIAGELASRSTNHHLFGRKALLHFSRNSYHCDPREGIEGPI
jgi:hypothetical protein